MKGTVLLVLLAAFGMSASAQKNSKNPAEKSQIFRPVNAEKRGNGIAPQTLVYILDDKVVPYLAFQKINPDEIQSVTLLKDSVSMKKYGKTGDPGVVLIKTKKFAASEKGKK